ncbi:GntR family transcriptional regulator [Nocardioides endophyticus]|uniref:GntR family transcriptional regulator n=1 Tax=Nocardioides endophyticus TaxID=1353775 RepID=A0ABP8YNA6_9ACTN
MSLSQLPSGSGRNRTTHSYVLNTLRNAILDGTLAGGTRLLQAEIAEQFNVSITPVREALRVLAGEDLVELDPHRGARVRRLDLTEVQELYELRISLEPLMVRRMIAALSDDTLDAAENLVEQMRATSDVVAWSEQNRQFHAMLAEPERASRLSILLTGLRDSAAPYVRLSLAASYARRRESDDEHSQLVGHFRARDTEAAIALTVQHLRSTLRTIEDNHTT